jgi:hypothetical protein
MQLVAQRDARGHMTLGGACERVHLLAHAHDGARLLAFLLTFLRLALVFLHRQRERIEQGRIKQLNLHEETASMVGKAWGSAWTMAIRVSFSSAIVQERRTFRQTVQASCFFQELRGRRRRWGRVAWASNQPRKRNKTKLPGGAGGGGGGGGG